tara:strand:- start:675 stop:1067 length:393 start_codon:yes stop_codon:yes gene_type:complete
MNSVFVLSGKTLCIRLLKQTDLHQSYYEVMSLLPEVDRTILRTREILDSLENEYIYGVVEDLNTHMIIGTGTIIITTYTQFSKVACIENIMIRKDYQNIGLGDIILQRLKYYCLNAKRCLRLTVNCDSNM